MRRTITETQRMVIYRQAALEIINENNMINSFLGGLAQTVGGSSLGKVLPDALVTGFKKKIIKSVFEKLNIDQGGGFSDFIENIIANVSIEDLGKMLKGDITCEEVSAILVSATTMSIANKGLKESLIPVIHYFSQYEIGDGFDVKKKKGGKDFKAVTVKHVEQMLDTLLGVLGEALLAKLIDSLIKDVLVKFISEHICTKLGFKSSKPEDDEDGKVTVMASDDISDDQLNVIDITPPPQLSGPQQPALGMGVNESNKEIKDFLSESYRRNFTVGEFKKVKIAMGVI